MRICHLLISFGMLLLASAPLAGQPQGTTPRQTKEEAISTNFGAKAGFTAALSLLNDFSIGGVPIEQVQNDYKVGYFASLFMRINFGRHFLQPEVSYNVNQCGVNFNKPQDQDMAIGSQTSSTAYIESKIHSIDIPVIYGYNFIKTGPYAMSVFGGPKIRYIWKRKSKVSFRNFDAEDLHESLRPLNVSFTLGVAVAISRIFFDFRYDIGLLNMSKGVTYTPSTEETDEYAVSYRRRDNVLSFSLGIFF
ncbi:MAG TPA: PorT family protein [Candidatus Bacteroides merdipullorum]|uniref:PorT family protein n=1 Tax=Candidatus Bacteroides merdipullorum TaxID=2838474 RepID=A0A9D2A2E3_9BACE|nr:PorT family protein [Candidatus Bacteroides merdipullorum]